jgi:hypothetical protein
MPPVRGPGRRTALLAALIGVLAAAPGAAAQPTPISATVSTSTSGHAMPSGFVGVSLEYPGVQQYVGRDPKALNGVFVQLVRNLAPGQHPVLRIGGNTADSTWWRTPATKPPRGANYALTQGWLASARALARAAGARLILGLNLAAGRPGVASAEARAILRTLRRYVQALEIGNEPDDYNVFPWYFDSRGRAVYARGRSYGLAAFTREFSRWRLALPKASIAGPALAQLTWLAGLGQFIDTDPGLKVVTIHRYPLRAVVTDPTSPVYPSIANLLSDHSSSGLAQNLAPSVQVAHGRGLTFRVDELNSASHFGKRGVSDTFASALWILDTLFNLASVGADGVNVHSRPDAWYGLFSFTQRHLRVPRGRRPRTVWRGFVRPEYYGLLMFEQAVPAGAHLLTATAPSGPVKVWATRSGARTRVVLINKDTTNSYQVQVQAPGAASADLQRLQAPSVTATSGVTLGGQTFGRSTTTGKLTGRARTEHVVAAGGSYTVTLPAASAAMLTQ